MTMMHRGPLNRAIVTATCLAALAACSPVASSESDTPAGPAPSSVPPAGELRAVRSAPEAPPTLASPDGIQPTLLAYEWFRPESGGFVSGAPPDGFRVDQVPAVPVDDMARIVVDEAAPPVEVSVTWFDDLSGPEPSGAATPVECLAGTSACEVRFGDGQVELILQVPADAQLAVVELMYDVPSLDVDRPFSLATYGFRVSRG